MTRATVEIQDRAGKLRFLFNDAAAREIGKFNSRAEFARALGMKENTLKSFTSEERYRTKNKSRLWTTANDALAEMLGFDGAHPIWRSGSLSEFEEFWTTQSKIIRQRAELTRKFWGGVNGGQSDRKQLRWILI